jgi:hypothetical protein
MAKKERQQIIGLEILKPDDPTLWKRALKSKSGRRAKESKLIFGSRTRPEFLIRLLDRLKRPR